MSIQYLPPFALLSTAIKTADDGETVTLSKELFTMLFAALADAAGFDAAWYRASYPDVAAAISQGDITSELQHFVDAGYQEGRTHRALPVDHDWYRQTYPDVDEALLEADDMDPQQHYDEFGYLEGRANSSAVMTQSEEWFEAIERSAILVGNRIAATEP